MNRDAVEDLLRPQAVAWARFARTRPDEWVQRLAEVKLLHDYAGRLSESFEAVTKTHTFRTTGAERKSSPILDSPVHTPCSKDRSPTHGGGMYFDPKTAPVSLPRPPSSQKKRCSVYRFTATLDYLVSAPLAALLARLVAILRRRSKSAPHAVVSLVSRLVSHTPAVRSS
jgi:hypothetical protein